jgi:hypothetical protein
MMPLQVMLCSTKNSEKYSALHPFRWFRTDISLRCEVGSQHKRLPRSKPSPDSVPAPRGTAAGALVVVAQPLHVLFASSAAQGAPERRLLLTHRRIAAGGCGQYGRLRRR